MLQVSRNKPIKKILSEQITKNAIETVTYKQWMFTDKCNMESVIKQSDDFINEFCLQVQKLTPHNFISKKQF